MIKQTVVDICDRSLSRTLHNLKLIIIGLILVLFLGCNNNHDDATVTIQISKKNEDATVGNGLIYKDLIIDWVQNEEVRSLITRAQEEGELHITTYSQDQVDVWCEAFTAEFGIKCSGRGIWGSQIVATLITEREATETVTDVIHLSMSQAEQLLSRGFVSEVDWTSVGVDPRRVWGTEGSGNAVATTQSQYTHFYNHNFIDESDLPVELEDWLDPKHKGLICSPDFLFRAGSGFIALFLGMDETVDLARRLIEDQDMVITSTCDTVIISGERPLMFLGYGNPPALLGNESIGQFWNPGLGVNLFSNMVASDARHPNAARLFVAWATSRRASSLSYEAIGQGWAGFGHGPTGLVSGSFSEIDLVYETPLNYSQRGENTRVFQERVFGSKS